ncbi:MAG: NfeD family protein [Sulfitobacter sp.]
MESYLQIWWVWLSAALVLAVIEALAPGWIFLGFAIGALVMAAVVSLASGLSGAATLAIFGALSLLAWVGLRIAFRGQSSGARIVTRDVNDN